MNKEFLQKGILLPAITGIVFAAVLFALVSSRFELLMPVERETALAYYDEINPAAETVAAENFDALEKNACIGRLIGEDELLLRYDADFTNNSICACVMPGSNPIGEPGTVYIRLTSNHASSVSKDKNVTLSGSFGERRYAFIETYSAENEREIFLKAPSAPKSLVVYYHTSNGAGITSNYRVLVFREVA